MNHEKDKAEICREAREAVAKSMELQLEVIVAVSVGDF